MKKSHPIYYEATITDVGAEGKAIARINDKVVFVPYGAPGDIVDIQVTKKKKSFCEGRIIHFHAYGENRATPFCSHFQECGGCKWQHLPYEQQLFWKQKQVIDHLTRIGKLDIPEVSPIIGAKNTTFYRNKLEYTFSDKKWLTHFDKDTPTEQTDLRGVGFHKTGMFDRIIDIDTCYLQADPSNKIRLAIKEYALERNLSFHNIRIHEGLLRNLMIRNSSTNDLMVVMVFYENQPTVIDEMMAFIGDTFPEITSLHYVVNNKLNDSFSDQEIILVKGLPYMREELEGIQFKISPVSFFQTNTAQTLSLYQTTRTFAGLTGNEVVYDLYTGTGSIALFIAHQAKKVVGIEYVEEAIADAKINAANNHIENTVFYAGDMSTIFTQEFVQANGIPDVIITDPPRAGMHPDVIQQLITLGTPKIVYVSCNSATQARDLELLKDHYRIKAVQPVDMFPHTHHVENVVLLEKK